MTDSPTLHAWVDESMQFPRDDLGKGLYILAATVADPTACDPVRDALTGLLLGKRRNCQDLWMGVSCGVSVTS